jgi:predicted LPLAT superfamily acyltransferase
MRYVARPAPDIAGVSAPHPRYKIIQYALDDTKRQYVPRRRRRTMASMNGVVKKYISRGERETLQSDYDRLDQ